MNRYDLEHALKTGAIYALVAGVVLLLAVGLTAAINHANVNIESRCQVQGGQVIRTPGELSRCLLPPTR